MTLQLVIWHDKSEHDGELMCKNMLIKTEKCMNVLGLFHKLEICNCKCVMSEIY